MLLSLVTRFWYVNPYLLCVFPVALFIICGKKVRITIVLYCAISTYDMRASLGMRLGFYLCVELRSFPHLRCHLSELYQ